MGKIIVRLIIIGIYCYAGCYFLKWDVKTIFGVIAFCSAFNMKLPNYNKDRNEGNNIDRAINNE